MRSPRVVVTRPAPAAAHWVAGLQAHGFDVLELPLVGIQPEPLAGALVTAREHLSHWSAVMFVSGNAVRCLARGMRFTAGAEAGLHVGAARAWSPGPGTTAALLAAGWPKDQLDAPATDAVEFDSEALWRQVGRQVGAQSRVLIACGGDAQGRVAGRTWLARAIAETGGVVESVVCYRRTLPQWSDTQQAQARALAGAAAIWVFSSAQSIFNLQRLLPGSDWSETWALVTHSRIGDAATAAGFGHVRLTQPTLAAVMASLENAA